MSEELVEIIRQDADDRMSKALDHTRTDFSTVRTGRANPALVERLEVEYYGSRVPLQQLAGFTVPDARMLVVTPFDKGSVEAIERAIRESNLGLNPSNDGTNVRLVFPVLTEERRREFVKLVRGMAEDGRNSIRGARRDARKDVAALARDGDISKDDAAFHEAEIDRISKEHEERLNDALDVKTKELMEG